MQPSHTALSSLLHTVSDAVLPLRCAACNTIVRRGVVLCAICDLSATPITAPCVTCGVPMDTPATTPCGACRLRRWPMTTSRAAFEHGGSIRTVLHHFKFGGRYDLAPPLAAYFDASAYPRRDWDLIVPVPLHYRRRWTRGYDQAALLARFIGRNQGLRADYQALRRTRPTQRQARLSATARADNVRGAFRAPRPQRLRGRTILLVDDVTTTGATMGAAARALRAAGARRVDGWSVARSD